MTQADARSLDVGPCEPTFESLRETIFAVGCNWEYCHGEQAPSGDLWLLAPDAERRLVNAAAVACAGWVLVVPGEPERSLLFRKLGAGEQPCGRERMPMWMPPLPPHALDCVRGWIESLPRDAAAE